MHTHTPWATIHAPTRTPSLTYSSRWPERPALSDGQPTDPQARWQRRGTMRRPPMTGINAERPDPYRLELLRRVFEPSCLDDVAEAVATEYERHVYVERVEG